MSTTYGLPPIVTTAQVGAYIKSKNVSQVLLRLDGAPSQTGNFLEVRNSAGTSLVTISSAGLISQAATSAATTGTVRNIIGAMTGSATGITTANLVGVRGSMTLTGTATGQAYLYGTQGKFVCTAGTLNGSAWAAGLVGQLDVNGGTLTAASHLTPIWGDFGATATGSLTFGDLLVLTNTTAATLNAHIYSYGKASYFADMSTNGSAFVATAAGATAGSTKKKIKIKVDGTDLYLLACSDWT